MKRKMHKAKVPLAKPTLAKPTPLFKRKAKKPEADDSPGKMRPAAHAPRQKGVSRRAKRLSGVML